MFTDEPIYSIALNCGFSDQAHLSSSLKNAEGTTPGKLRGKK
jgi:transcriptional regulator GlxA family with amidase domain